MFFFITSIPNLRFPSVTNRVIISAYAQSQKSQEAEEKATGGDTNAMIAVLSKKIQVLEKKVSMLEVGGVIQ